MGLINISCTERRERLLFSFSSQAPRCPPASELNLLSSHKSFPNILHPAVMLLCNISIHSRYNAKSFKRRGLKVNQQQCSDGHRAL